MAGQQDRLCRGLVTGGLGEIVGVEVGDAVALSRKVFDEGAVVVRFFVKAEQGGIAPILEIDQRPASASQLSLDRDHIALAGIIGGIVKSEPFQMRTAPPAPAAPTNVARGGLKAALDLQ